MGAIQVQFDVTWSSLKMAPPEARDGITAGSECSEPNGMNGG